jgi:hypothetical protein
MSGPIEDALHARGVELFEVELGSQRVGYLALALPLFVQCLCAGERGLLSGVRHKPAVNQVHVKACFAAGFFPPP